MLISARRSRTAVLPAVLATSSAVANFRARTNREATVDPVDPIDAELKIALPLRIAAIGGGEERLMARLSRQALRALLGLAVEHANASARAARRGREAPSRPARNLFIDRSD